jgi:hypothetical protein
MTAYFATGIFSHVAVIAANSLKSTPLSMYRSFISARQLTSSTVITILVLNSKAACLSNGIVTWSIISLRDL